MLEKIKLKTVKIVVLVMALLCVAFFIFNTIRARNSASNNDPDTTATVTESYSLD